MNNRPRLLLITDTFPPAFAPRMGYLCKYLKTVLRWQIVAVHAKASEKSHASTFQHLCGYADQEFAYEMSDGIHGCSFWEKLRAVRCGDFGFGALLAFVGSKVWYHLTGHALDWGPKKAVRLALESFHPDVILGSSGTFGSGAYELAEYAGRISGIPVVQDWRDIAEEVSLEPQGKRDRKSRLVRDRCVRAAAINIAVMRSHCERLKSINENTELVYNGYDPSVFEPCKAARTDAFNLVYIGSMYPNLSRLDLLFEALQRFLNVVDKARDVRVLFYSSPSTFEHCVRPSVATGRETNFQLMPSVPQSSLREEVLSNAAVLLTASNDAKGGIGAISTKVFEYLISDRPVLLVKSGETSESADLVMRANAGIASSDVAKIVDFLCAKYDEWKKNGFVAGTTDIAFAQQFSRDISSRQIADILMCASKNNS